MASKKNKRLEELEKIVRLTVAEAWIIDAARKNLEEYDANDKWFPIT